MLNIIFDDLVTLLTEVYIRVVADGVPTPQCVDLAQLWNRVIGGPRFTGDAHTIYDQAGTTYTQVPNTPTGVPPKGAIVVWSAAFNGGPGHVAVATGEGDTNKFKALEQNDTTGGTDSSVQVKEYDYTDVQGWLVPNQLPQNQQGLIDQLRKERDDNYNISQEYLQELDKCQTDLKTCQSSTPTPQPPTIPTPTPSSNSGTQGQPPVPNQPPATTIPPTQPNPPVEVPSQPTPKKPNILFLVWQWLIEFFIIGH